MSLRDPVTIVSKDLPEDFFNFSEFEQGVELDEDCRGSVTGLNAVEHPTTTHVTESSLPPVTKEQDVGYHKPGSELVEPRYVRERTPQAVGVSASKEIVLSSANAPQQLTFYFEKENTTLDRDHPISSREFFGLSIYSVFKLIAQRTGKSVASVKFKHHNYARKVDRIALERYNTKDQEWDDMKEGMKATFAYWKSKLPDEKDFAIKIITNFDDEQDEE